MNYRFCWNVEGHGFTDIDAEDEDEAYEKFWAMRDSEIIEGQDYEIEVMHVSEEGGEQIDGNTD